MLGVKSSDLKQAKTETIVIPVCEDENIHKNNAILSLIKQAMNYPEFKGEKDQELTLYNPLEFKITRAVFIGMGKCEKVDIEALRAFSGQGVRRCIDKNISEILITVPDAKNLKTDTSAIVYGMMEGGFLANHLFDRYKKKKEKEPLRQIDFLLEKDEAEKYGSLTSKVETVCAGTILAREWVSTPSNDKQPEEFTDSIVAVAEKEELEITVLDQKALEQQKFNAMLSVAAGSQSSPRLIILAHQPRGAAKTIALVGKGVTFDSGGINLKPSKALEDMKQDMSGAAAVAATMITLSRLKMPVNVIGVIPVVENMPSGNAARPGDIVKTYNGKTVEISNTDAEGRLILCDAISYVIEKYKPGALIDVATLTGACVVALGEKIAGLFSLDQQLADAIIKSGLKTHERCWQLPLPHDYKELLKSDFADLNNVSNSGWGGAITAALFLSEFAEHTRWAHIVIAGTAYIKKQTEYCNPGGTGFGVRLLINLLEEINL